MSSTKEKNFPKAAPSKSSLGDILVEGRISAPAKQLFNLLLRKAFQRDEPPLDASLDKMETEHEILTEDIQSEISDAKDIGYLRDTLDSLCVKVRYDIIDSEGENRRGFFIILPQAEMEEDRGVCRYAFSPRMLALMTDSAFSAKMSLLLRRRYKGGKYGRLIYELCLEHKEAGQTPFLSIDKLKNYLGVGKDVYPEFKIFNRDLLKPIIKEINKQTDLLLELNTRRTGRKITHLGFSVAVRPTFRPASIFSSNKQDESETKQKLTSLGVSESLAEQLNQIHSFKYIKMAAEVLEKHQKKARGGAPLVGTDKILSKIIKLGQKRLVGKQNPDRQSWRKTNDFWKIEACYSLILRKIRRLNGHNRKALKQFLEKGDFANNSFQST